MDTSTQYIQKVPLLAAISKTVFKTDLAFLILEPKFFKIQPGYNSLDPPVYAQIDQPLGCT